MAGQEFSGAAAVVPASGKKQRILLILCFAAFTTMLGVGIVTPALPLYAQLMGASGLWIGIIFSSFALSRTLFLPVFGSLSDRRGRRLILLIGLSGYAIFSALYVLAGTVEVLTFVRFLHGIAASMVFPVAVAYVADIAAEGEEGQMVGGFLSAAFLGLSFGPLISGVMMDHFGVASAFLALAVISVATAGVCLVSLPDYRARPREQISILSVFCHEALRVPILFYLMYSVAYATFLVYLPLIARSAGEFSGMQVGILIFVGTVVMAVVQKQSGRIVDASSKYTLMAVGMGIIAIASAGIALAGNFTGYLGAVIVLGCGFGISLTAASALVAIAGRTTGQGSAAGVVNMAQGIGLIIVPVVFGIVMDSAGIRIVFVATALATLVSVPVLISAGRKPRVSSPGGEPVPLENQREIHL
jgi:DHA1 family multidrug resistance protein-like MFS transporter